MLNILFTQDPKVGDCSVVLFSALNLAYSSAAISPAWGLSQFKMTFNMIARMTDEADSSGKAVYCLFMKFYING